MEIKESQWRRIYKALERIAYDKDKRRWQSSLYHVFYRDGYIYACNEFVMCRVWVYGLEVAVSDVECEPVEGMAYTIDINRRIEEATDKVPDFEILFFDNTKYDSKMHAFDPKFMNLICNVYKAAKLNPIFECSDSAMQLAGCDKNIEVKAVLMGVRV